MEQNLLKNYRIFKEIQLLILIIITAVFLSFFLYYPTIRANILTNSSLLLIFGIGWLVLLLSYIFLLYDFTKMELFISHEHALKREAYLDNLTGIPNRHGFDTVFKHYQSGKDLSSLGCALLSISNLTEINENAGYETGDILIKYTSSILESIGEEYGFVGRNGGNEFLAVFDHCSSSIMEHFYNDILSALHEFNDENPQLPDIIINFEYLLNSEVETTRLSDLVTLTYKKAAAKK